MLRNKNQVIRFTYLFCYLISREVIAFILYFLLSLSISHILVVNFFEVIYVWTTLRFPDVDLRALSRLTSVTDNDSLYGLQQRLFDVYFVWIGLLLTYLQRYSAGYTV